MGSLQREHWAEKARRAIRVAERGRDEREAKRAEAKRAYVALRRACAELDRAERS